MLGFFLLSALPVTVTIPLATVAAQYRSRQPSRGSFSVAGAPGLAAGFFEVGVTFGSRLTISGAFGAGLNFASPVVVAFSLGSAGSTSATLRMTWAATKETPRTSITFKISIPCFSNTHFLNWRPIVGRR